MMFRSRPGRTTRWLIALFIAVLANACVQMPVASSASPTPAATVAGGTTPTLAPSATPARMLRWSSPAVLPESAALLDVVRWRDRYVGVADAVVANAHTAVAMVSTDGTHWTRVATFDGMPLLLATREVLVALVPHTDPAHTDAWVSGDGQTWRPETQLALSSTALSRAVAFGDTLIATAEREGRTDAVWRSAGGAPWTSAPVPAPTAVIRQLATVRDGVLAIGRDGSPDAGAGGVGVPGTGRPAAWFSTDGRSWSTLAVEGGSAPGAQLLSIFGVTAGYLALGSDVTTAGGNPRSPLLWESPAGRDWKLVGPPGHWGIAGADGRELVVFTAADLGTTALGVWTTGDGHAWNRVTFVGDVANAPAYETSVGQSSRVDRIFAMPDGVIVMGQRGGQITAWLAQLVR